MGQSEHPFGQPSRMPSQSRGTPLVAYGSISRNGSIEWVASSLPYWHLAGPKKAWILVVYPEKACILVALETADANMRLPLIEIVYGFTGCVIHRLVAL